MKFNLEATEEDVNLIGSILDEQPYKKVSDLAKRWQAQIESQMIANHKRIAAEQQATLDKHIEAEVAKRIKPEVPAANAPSPDAP